MVPEFVGLDHVQLGMTHGAEDEARAFYVSILGLTEVLPPPPLRGLWFRAGGCELHLHVEENYRPSARVHPALQVRGRGALALLASRCAAAGHTPRQDERYPGRSRFYVADPFGNQIEILQLDGEGD